ncbi:hypothetical protein OC835_000855 [Tilletia horrida]|nr:hypothetical protein OC835_000855 [Tilletia horrida]
MSRDSASGSHAPAGTTPSTGAPLTTQRQHGEPDTVPTASATGAPRIFGRHTELRHGGKKVGERAQRSAAATAATRRRREQQHSSSGYDGNGEESDSEVLDSEFDEDEDDEDEDGAPPPEMAPSGSLTLAALSPSSSLPLSRRAALLASALAINLGLPFVNGIMLGFGEIVARTLLAPWIGVVLGPLLPARFGFGGGLGTAQAGLGAGGANTSAAAQRDRRNR